MKMRVSGSGLVKSHIFQGIPRPVLVDLDFSWESGQLVCLSGKNGSGKTTLLRLLAGLDRPDFGVITIFRSPDDVGQSSMEFLRNVGVLLPSHVEFPDDMSARQALEEILILDGLSPSEIPSRLDCTNKRLDLSGFWNFPWSKCSRGQQAQLSIARLMVLERKCWWLDEPFASLDSNAIESVCAWMESRLCVGDIVVLCTHQSDATPTLQRSWPVPVVHWELASGRLLDKGIQ